MTETVTEHPIIDLPVTNRRGNLMSKRVLIIGAGPGGLAAAMLLARSGLQVTVLERSSSVGGRTSTIRSNGFRFDLGPTFFLYPRVLAEIFQAVGRDLREEVELVRLDPQYRLIFGGGGELLATPVVERMERAIAALSPDRRRFLSIVPGRQPPEAGQLQDVFGKPVPRLARRSALADPQAVAAAAALALARSGTGPVLPRSPRPPGVFVSVEVPGYVALQLSEPLLHPLVPRVRVRRASPDRRLRGGNRSHGPHRTELGGEIRLDEPVEEVLFDRKRAVGVRTSEGCYKADAVIVNADFAHAMTRLVPDHLRRRWTDRKIARKRYSCSTFMMYLGIEGRFDHLDHHTIYMAKDYVRNLEEIEAAPRAFRGSVFLRSERLRDRSDPGAAGHEHALRSGSRDAPASERGLGAGARTVTEASFSGSFGGLDIEDVERRIRFERVVTPADWEQQHGDLSRRDFQPRPQPWARCCTCGRGIGSRTWTAFIWSAAAPTRAAACR